MGFGWMFLGYCLLLGTNIEFLGVPVDITPDVIAFLLMLKGFNVANEHCESFRVSRIFAMIGIPVLFFILGMVLYATAGIISIMSGCEERVDSSAVSTERESIMKNR